MADEPTDAAGGKSSLVGKLVGLTVVVLVPVILGLVVFKLLLMPVLGGATEAAEPEVIDPIPAEEVTLRFDMPEETVHTEGAGNLHPILMYTVVLMCRDQLTADLITAQEDRFVSTVSALHRNRTLTELNDPAFQDYLAAQVRDEINILLKRLRPQEQHEVREVKYLKFAILSL